MTFSRVAKATGWLTALAIAGVCAAAVLVGMVWWSDAIWPTGQATGAGAGVWLTLALLTAGPMATVALVMACRWLAPSSVAVEESRLVRRGR
ncbi:MAG: hypothetical protein AAF823_08490 [Planctomycetota bacterium]